ncbi:MAG TPA: radical SAM protein, partial [Polyangia bacterium]
ERRLVVKPNAPALLDRALRKKSWRKEAIVFSGVTDCYQPIEASYRLTRQCLEVCAAHANPVGIITKGPLIERDIDVLKRIAERASVHVIISVPFWDEDNARAIEPYVATPSRRIRIIETLASAGIDVGVNIAPVIPGLSDQDIPRILSAARAAGATSAGYVLLRLPGSVPDVFISRLKAGLPLVADRVIHRVRETRGGDLYDSRYGIRGRGEGVYAQSIAALFRTTATRLGFEVFTKG